jgi:crossover junction endodeoxyribonuclease RusA
MISFRIEMKPEPKGRPRMNTKTARTYTPAKTRHYEQEFRRQARPHRPKVPLGGRLYLKLEFHLPRPKRCKRLHPTVKPDLDNLIKSVMDPMSPLKLKRTLLEQGFWKDDAQITELKARKVYATGNPMIQVEIIQLTEGGLF